MNTGKKTKVSVVSQKAAPMIAPITIPAAIEKTSEPEACLLSLMIGLHIEPVPKGKSRKSLFQGGPRCGSHHGFTVFDCDNARDPGPA